MKKLSFIFVLTLFSFALIPAGLAAQTDQQTTEKLTPDDYHYTGEITQENLMNGHSKRWFNRGYKNYNPSKKTINQIAKDINKYDISVYMGVWCPDSRRELPKLYKLLDETKYNKEDNLTVYAVNHSMKTEDGYEKEKNIKRVPTIIFYDKKGNEVNRYVEHPINSLEDDILTIVSGKDYTNFAEVK